MGALAAPGPIEPFLNAAARDAAIPTPKIGQGVFLQDTGALLFYYGGSIGYQPPWNVAWGNQYITTVTSDSAALVIGSDSLGSWTPVPGFTVSGLVQANRIMRPQLITNAVSTLFVATIAVRMIDDRGNVIATGGGGTGLVGFAVPSQITLTARVVNYTQEVRSFRVEAFMYDDASANTAHFASASQATTFVIDDVGAYANPQYVR